LLRQLDQVLVTSPIDRQALLDLAGGEAQSAPVTVLPNGVDASYFTPDTAVRRDPATVVFSGKMSYHANVTMALHLAQHIMPYVWARRPEVKLLVVGKDPPREIVSLQEAGKIEVTGTVSDLRPYLHQATVAAVPLVYGAGSQFKVLEAMACATPVVATPQAIAPLSVQAGREVLVAQEPAEFAQQVLAVLDDPQQQQRLGQAGRRYVETHHAWSRVAEQLSDVYGRASQRSLLQTERLALAV
jgi:glycosyltransferase involved in cell wall biosynthesis